MAGILQAARQSVSGRALIGGFDVNGQSFAWINFLKGATNITGGTTAFPGNLDNNGYPISAPATTAIAVSFVIPISATYSAQRYVFKQRSGTTGTWGDVRITLPSGTFTVNADDNTNLVANSGANLTVAGANPRLDLTFNGLPNTGNGNTLTLTFLTTGGGYTTPDIVLCRYDQEALLDAGEIFNPDFITLLRNLNPKIVRTMDWSAVNSSLWSQFDYRAPTTALSYRTARWQPSAWVGSIAPSGNNFTCSAPADWSALAEGVTLQGQYTGGLQGVLAVLGGNVTASISGTTMTVSAIPTVTSFTGAISGTTLTVSAGDFSNGNIALGHHVVGAGITTATTIAGFGTGTGGNGTYFVNNSQTVGSGSMTTSSTTLCVGLAVTGTGVTAGTVITALGTGVDGTGTYTVNNSQTVASRTLATGATNNGSGAIRLFLADTSSLSTSQRVTLTSSGGSFDGGGVWTITVIDATKIDLQNSTYQAAIKGTITTNTVQVGATAAKILSASAGNPAIAANDVATLVYDSVRDSWLTVSRGMGDASSNGMVPIEIQVALANKLRVHLWSNFHFHYTDASITAHANYVRDNLSSSLNCYYELSNEIWNPGFTQFNHAYVRGQQLGFPTANAQNFSYHALRSRMVFGLIESSYGARTNYKRVIANQLYGNTTATKTYKFNGADLAPSGTSTGTGNATYNTFTGSADYTQFPDRPIDHTDSISFATYYSGATLTGGEYSATGTYTGMTGAVDDFVAGNYVSAFSWIDSDLQSGTSTIPGFTSQTLDALPAKYSAWETVATSYDVERSGGGLAALTVDHYEGGLENIAPTTSQCTTIGISTTYGNTVSGQTITARGTVQQMLDAYKASSNFRVKVKSQYDDFMSETHSATPAWFALQGTLTTSGKWSMLPGSTYTAPSYLGVGFVGGRYTSWDGTVDFNG